MSSDEEDDDVIFVGESRPNDRDKTKRFIQSPKSTSGFNCPRLSFYQPPLKKSKANQTSLLEELPDLTTDNEQPRKVTNLYDTSLKRCRVVFNWCDEKRSPAKSRFYHTHPIKAKLESVGKKRNFLKSHKEASLKSKAFKDIKNYDSKSQPTNTTYSVSAGTRTLTSDTNVVSRLRMMAEPQAVSCQMVYDTPIAIFNQPPPIRTNLPSSRIGYHRQACSSPFRIDFPKNSTKRQVLPIRSSEVQYEGTGYTPEKLVQIFHRTVKRVQKLEFEELKENSDSLFFLNQMLNLKRNIIFGQYWSVFVPCFQTQKSKKHFTEYHEAFIEAALEQEENPEYEALSLLKDFQSKHCPTLKSISSIVTNWKKNTTDSEEKYSDVVRVLVQVFESYPEVTKAYVDRALMSIISKIDVKHPESSLVMAALELDFFTKTLCDSFTMRRSLINSFVSLWRNRDIVLGFVQIIKANIRGYVDKVTDPTMVTAIYFYQRLLALVLESSLSQKNADIAQMANMLIQVYRGVEDMLERQLLLSSIASPLLTSVLAKQLLQEQGYLTDCGGAWGDWNLSFQDHIQFLKQFTLVQQEEFALLFYFAVWAVLETSKHNLLRSRSDCLLDFGLGSSSMPPQLQHCTAQVISMADKLPDKIGHNTRLFLDLTNCLFHAKA